MYYQFENYISKYAVSSSYYVIFFYLCEWRLLVVGTCTFLYLGNVIRRRHLSVYDFDCFKKSEFYKFQSHSTWPQLKTYCFWGFRRHPSCCHRRERLKFWFQHNKPETKVQQTETMLLIICPLPTSKSSSAAPNLLYIQWVLFRFYGTQT